ncbi:enoyl-CoA hydratase-related protein [Haliea sp. E17]|uniref:enoyl-CoA hydratase-related protein n=1 Tax=Haliea sp. E17 TaxID=3401576 RepID=UPI003AAEBF47
MNTPQLSDSTLDINGRVALLTLNRDDLRNALTGSALVDEIIEVCQWINATPDISVLVITGAGKAFSSGGNIKDMRDRTADFAGDVAELEANYRRGIQRIPLAIDALEVPVIAAVNGAAIGAGFDLANMCDVRIGSTEALFGETFINLGIIPGDGGAWFLQRVVGYQRAAELTFSGRLVKAQEAQEIGILLEVTAPDALLPRALELAQAFAGKPPQAVRYTKRLLKKAQRSELRDFLDLCAVYQGISHNTEDHGEAVSAFLEKREPSYKGK